MRRLVVFAVISLLFTGCSLSAVIDRERKTKTETPVPTVTLPSVPQKNKSNVVPQMRGKFLGQDGQSYAGKLCQTGLTSDNIHIRLEGLRSDVSITGYRVDEPSGGGLWSYPCDPVSNWLLYVTSTSPETADLYFKPFRDAPLDTAYNITVNYSDGTQAQNTVYGTQVKVTSLTGLFIGQDGQSYSGTGCTAGTTPDNVHIQVKGFRPEIKVVSYRVEDIDGHGLWAYPCDPASNWMLNVVNSRDDALDLYFKPFRLAPDGTRYRITITYKDGSEQEMILTGSEIGR